MSYIAPKDFAVRMIDAGQSKALMSTRDTLIRSYMAGAILALAAAFALSAIPGLIAGIFYAMLRVTRETYDVTRAALDERAAGLKAGS